MSSLAGCPLCETPGGAVVFEGHGFRVVRAQEPNLPAFWRLIWTAHAREFSDLPAADRHRVVDALVCIEEVVRARLQPTKVNIASLGNVVPHLHWHVIARFDWDTHFPSPVWCEAQRAPDADRLAQLSARCDQADALIAQALAAAQPDQTAF